MSSLPENRAWVGFNDGDTDKRQGTKNDQLWHVSHWHVHSVTSNVNFMKDVGSQFRIYEIVRNIKISSCFEVVCNANLLNMKLIKSTFGKFWPIIGPHRVACGGG